MTGVPQAGFVEAAQGRLFCLSRQPAARAESTVLVLPAFGEEMNKMRRMVSETTRALADRGVASVVFDLYGTGDSDGEFAEATWEGWLENVATVVERAAAGGTPITHILGIRLGCLLAADYVRAHPGEVRRCIFWQPVADGARFFDQLVRLRLAAGLSGSGPKENSADLREKLRRDGALEIAGYEISAALVGSMSRLRMAALATPDFPRIDWLEILRSADATVPVAQSRIVDELRAGGCDVRLHTTVAEPIWASTEIVVSPDLADTTVKLVCAP